MYCIDSLLNYINSRRIKQSSKIRNNCSVDVFNARKIMVGGCANLTDQASACKAELNKMNKFFFQFFNEESVQGIRQNVYYRFNYKQTMDLFRSIAGICKDSRFSRFADICDLYRANLIAKIAAGAGSQGNQKLTKEEVNVLFANKVKAYSDKDKKLAKIMCNPDVYKNEGYSYYGILSSKSNASDGAVDIGLPFSGKKERVQFHVWLDLANSGSNRKTIFSYIEDEKNKIKDEEFNSMLDGICKSCPKYDKENIIDSLRVFDNFYSTLNLLFSQKNVKSALNKNNVSNTVMGNVRALRDELYSYIQSLFIDKDEDFENIMCFFQNTYITDAKKDFKSFVSGNTGIISIKSIYKDYMAMNNGCIMWFCNKIKEYIKAMRSDPVNGKLFTSLVQVDGNINTYVESFLEKCCSLQVDSLYDFVTRLKIGISNFLNSNAVNQCNDIDTYINEKARVDSVEKTNWASNGFKLKNELESIGQVVFNLLQDNRFRDDLWICIYRILNIRH